MGPRDLFASAAHFQRCLVDAGPIPVMHEELACGRARSPRVWAGAARNAVREGNCQPRPTTAWQGRRCSPGELARRARPAWRQRRRGRRGRAASRGGAPLSVEHSPVACAGAAHHSRHRTPETSLAGSTRTAHGLRRGRAPGCGTGPSWPLEPPRAERACGSSGGCFALGAYI